MSRKLCLFLFASLLSATNARAISLRVGCFSAKLSDKQSIVVQISKLGGNRYQVAERSELSFSPDAGVTYSSDFTYTLHVASTGKWFTGNYDHPVFITPVTYSGDARAVLRPLSSGKIGFERIVNVRIADELLCKEKMTGKLVRLSPQKCAAALAKPPSNFDFESYACSKHK